MSEIDWESVLEDSEDIYLQDDYKGTNELSLLTKLHKVKVTTFYIQPSLLIDR